PDVVEARMPARCGAPTRPTHPTPSPYRGCSSASRLRLRLQRLGHDLLNEIIPDLAWRPAPWLVIEAVKTIPHKPPTPALYRLARCSNGSCDGTICVPSRRQQNNLGAHRVPARNLTSPCAPFQLHTFDLGEHNFQ